MSENCLKTRRANDEINAKNALSGFREGFLFALKTWNKNKEKESRARRGQKKSPLPQKCRNGSYILLVRLKYTQNRNSWKHGKLF